MAPLYRPSAGPAYDSALVIPRVSRRGIASEIAPPPATSVVRGLLAPHRYQTGVVDGRPRVPSLSIVRPASEPRPVATAPAWHEALPKDLLTGLHEYEVDWEDLFRVDTFQAWRAGLSQRRDAASECDCRYDMAR